MGELMKRMLAGLLLVASMTMLFSGCGEDSAPPAADTSFATTDEEMFTDRDYRVTYDADTAVMISLNGDSASCASDKVQISGSTVTISDEGTYVLSGTLDGGMLVVDAQATDKPQIVLNGVSVTSETSAPLYIKEADKVFVTLAEGTQNTLANGGTFAAIDESSIDGAVFSRQDLTMNGGGALTVLSPAGHGIVCKDDLVLTGGTYEITAAGGGIKANDSIRITGAELSVSAGKDGLHAENADDTALGYVYISGGALHITAGGDGISAGAFLQIQGGTFTVASGSSPTDDCTSMKGLKATAGMLINGGTFGITAEDDAVHSNTSITVNGGAFEISSGDDAFHADEALVISQGEITVTESYEGLEALNIEISGGSIRLVASDDGINAAGGVDSSGFSGTQDAYGGRPGGMGGPGGARPPEQFGGSSSSNGLISISGGTVYIQASGDGIDANGDLNISGGSITVCGPTVGDTAVLDYDGTGTISGGTFIGTGAYMMAQTLSGSGQGVLGVSVGNRSAGTEIVVKDSNGNTVLTHTPALPYQIVIISSPDIVKGEEYTLAVGSDTGTVSAQ